MPRTRTSILATLVAALFVLTGPVAVVTTAADDAKHSPEVKAADGKASAAHGEPNILEPQPSLMIWTVIVFGVLLAILWKFAWGPMSQALDERERKQEETLQAAAAARTESERLLAEHKKQMDLAAEQVRQMLDEARRQSDANALTIVQQAQAEAEAEREKTKREIASAKEQAVSEIWQQTADLAVSVAGKVLSKTLNEEDHRRLVDSAVGELQAHANGHGEDAK